MKPVLRALALAGALFAAPLPVHALDFFTAGDSHCPPIAQALGWRTVAVNGAPTSDLARQLAHLPFGAFVIACTGTNDAAREDMAAASAFHLRAALDVAEWKGQKLVVIGPSAVRRAGWRERAGRIDGYFEALTRAQGVPYVSIFADPARQPGPDHVHLARASYLALGKAAALQLQD